MHRFRQFGPLSKKNVVVGAAIVIAIGSVAAVVYHLGFYTPPIAERGHVTAASASNPTMRVSAATRLIVLRGSRFWQLEFPGGVWNDCRPNCAQTLRKAAFNE
jgi:hypothetical protein